MRHPRISVAHRGHTINSSDDGASHNSSLIMSLYSCLNETRPRHGEFLCVHRTRVTHTSVDSSSVRVARIRFDQTTGKNHEIETGKNPSFFRSASSFRGGSGLAVKRKTTIFYPFLSHDFYPFCVRSSRLTLFSVGSSLVYCVALTHGRV